MPKRPCPQKEWEQSLIDAYYWAAVCPKCRGLAPCGPRKFDLLIAILGPLGERW